jgi:lipopolysaccharide export system permease protein
VSILSRYVVKEILSHLFGVLSVVLGIFLIRRIGVLVDDTAGASVSTGTILHLLGLRTLMALPSLLPVVLYLSVLLGLSRLYRDHEMTALIACGVAPGRVRAAVAAFGVTTAAVVGVLSFYVRPWAAMDFETLRHRAVAAVEMGSMSPGRFYEVDSDQEQVMFAEAQSSADRRVMEGLFVQQRDKGQLSIFLSDSAVEHRDEESGYRLLRLGDGRRYDLDFDGGDHAITRFHEFVIRTPLGDVPKNDLQEETRPTSSLLASIDPEHRAEVHWRLAMPLSTLLLVAVAVPLSRVDPRQGKYAKILVAIMIYLAYRQLLGMTKNWVAGEVIEPLAGFLGVHALCLATAIALFAREAGWRPLRAVSLRAGRTPGLGGGSRPRARTS